MAVVLKLARLLSREPLPQFDGPLSFVFLPVAAGDLGVEGHVLAQVKDAADLVEVGPQIGRVRVEARPVWVLSTGQNSGPFITSTVAARTRAN